MYRILGWLNAGLLLVMTAPFWLRFLNERLFHLKGGAYAKTIKALRTIHKPLGGAILLIGFIHGYLALGAFRPHTGALVALSILATAILGFLFYKLRKKGLFLWHRRSVLLIVLFLLIHLIFPSALYYLFG